MPAKGVRGWEKSVLRSVRFANLVLYGGVLSHPRWYAVGMERTGVKYYLKPPLKHHRRTNSRHKTSHRQRAAVEQRI